MSVISPSYRLVVLPLAALVLAACGGGVAETSTPASVVTVVVTATPTEATGASAETSIVEPTATATLAPEPADTPEPTPTLAPLEANTIPTDFATAEPQPPDSTPEAPTPTLVPLEVNTFPTGDVFGDELQFQALASDPSAGADNGAGIADVTFRVVDGQGRTVHERVERNPLYCAFGGGDNGQDCNVWRFSENGGAWPSGIPVENGGAYRLQVTVRTTGGRETSQELPFTIQL